MEEPSILDYLKAKLTPWRGKAPEIPPLEGGEPPPRAARKLPDQRRSSHSLRRIRLRHPALQPG